MPDLYDSRIELFNKKSHEKVMSHKDSFFMFNHFSLSVSHLYQILPDCFIDIGKIPKNFDLVSHDLQKSKRPNWLLMCWSFRLVLMFNVKNFQN